MRSSDKKHTRIGGHLSVDPSERRCGTSPPMATVPGLLWAGERVPERTLAQGGGAGPQRGPASVPSLPVSPGGCAWSRGGSSEVAPWLGVRSPAQRPLRHFRFRSARPRQNRRCRGGRGGWSSGSACRAQRRHHSGRVDVTRRDERSAGPLGAPEPGLGLGPSDVNTCAPGLGGDAAFGTAAGRTVPSRAPLCPYL